MLSYTQRRNIAGKLSNDDSSGNLSFLDTLMNEHDRQLLSKFPWWFMQATRTFTTTSSQSTLTLPSDVRKVENLTLTSGATIYPIALVNTRDEWDLIRHNSSITATYPNWAFVFGGQIHFFPAISSAGNTITLTYQRRQIDLTQADYTTGTIASATNDDATIEGGSTSWTSAHAENRWLRITVTDTAKTGDGLWYEVSSVTDSDTLELVSPYQGTSFSSGTGAYIIAQVSLLPEEYHMLPVYYGMRLYYITESPSIERSDRFKQMYDELYFQMVQDHNSRTTNKLVNTRRQRVVNPNRYPSNLS